MIGIAARNGPDDRCQLVVHRRRFDALSHLFDPLAKFDRVARLECGETGTCRRLIHASPCKHSSRSNQVLRPGAPILSDDHGVKKYDGVELRCGDGAVQILTVTFDDCLSEGASRPLLDGIYQAVASRPRTGWTLNCLLVSIERSPELLR